MTASKNRNPSRTSSALSQIWETRTQLVKSEQAAASAANDAKTLRLRALRLEKERLEAEEAALSGAPSEKAAPKAKVKRIVVS